MQLIFDFYCQPSQMELTVDAQLQLLYDGSLTLCHIYHTGEAALPRHPSCISTQMWKYVYMQEAKSARKTVV